MLPKTRIRQFLAKELQGDHVVAIRPDHPQLFSGPDILVGAKGTLTAVFWRSANDGKDCNDLLARLTATRLALPARTQCILMVEPDAPEPNPSVYANFGEQLDQHSAADLTHFIRSGPRASIREVPRDIKERAVARFALLTQFNTVRFRVASRTPEERRTHLSKSDFGNWWTDSPQAKVLRRARMRKPKDVVVEEPAAVASKRWEDIRSGLLNRTRSLCVYSLRSEYNLDTGVPYPLDLVPNILALDRSPEASVLEHKGIRALAFAGWATIAVQDIRELRFLQQHLAEASKRRNIL